MSTMREAAEKAETDQFNPAIEAASGAEGTLGSLFDIILSHILLPQAEALQVGKIKNKVLKLTGLSQILKIQVYPFPLHV